MEKNQSVQYTGTVWSSEQKNGPSYRISMDYAKIKDIETDTYGNILFSISKRKEQNPKNNATHNIYLCRDPKNYLNDNYAILNLSLNKQKLIDLKDNYDHCEIIAFPLSQESRLKDNAKANYNVTNNLSKEERSDNTKRENIGKGWNIYHKKEKTGEKQYVGNGYLKEYSGVKFLNAYIESEKIRTLGSSNNVYINLAKKKDKENEFSVYISQTKTDKWALFTIALDKEKTLTITPTDKGMIPITLSYKKEESIGQDKANINVKANSISNRFDPGDYPDGMNPELYGLEEKQEKQNFFVGKGWSKENMYWLSERQDEIDQVVTIEKTKNMEGKGLTNKGLHIFQTVKNNYSEETPSIDTANSYFLKEGFVYHEKEENSILPKNGYPYLEFIKNYESLKEDYISSTFYNIDFLPEKEKSIFFENSPVREEEDSKKKIIQAVDPDRNPINSADDFSPFSEALFEGISDKKKEIVKGILDSESTDDPEIKKGMKI